MTLFLILLVFLYGFILVVYFRIEIQYWKDKCDLISEIRKRKSVVKLKGDLEKDDK